MWLRVALLAVSVFPVGRAFVVALTTAIGVSLTVLENQADWQTLLQPRTEVDRWTLVLVFAELAALALGICGWVLMLARRWLAGAALALFGVMLCSCDVALVGQTLAGERAYAQSFNDGVFAGIRPPIGTLPALLRLVDSLSIAVGVIWGIQYYLAPPPLVVGSAFEPMMAKDMTVA